MNILYEDKHILVCFKEAGIAVQSARIGQKDLVSLLKNHLALSSTKGEPYLGVIHRLDQPVSGILVFAKTPSAAAKLSAQAADKTSMEKIYLAKVHLPASKVHLPASKGSSPVPENASTPSPTCSASPTCSEESTWFTLQDYLLKDGKTNTSKVVTPTTPGAKKSELQYQVLSYDPGTATAEVKIHLLTGRHHQIRVQFAHAGMPLVGDRKYGHTDDTDPLALCAAALAFTHPATKKKMHFSVSSDL